ncbi:MAG: hypothetical protein Q4B42_07285, partial [Oscillospiraceae bacterium]|nr:hypothetical protein [Oscillospiraceae bacterium]
MNYIVMESRLSYAVVLSEDGRFIKAANRRYEVGQTVSDIIEMRETGAATQKKKARIYSLAAIAACLLLLATSVLHTVQQTYATVYLSINPEIRIDVNRSDTVVGLDGVNSDGETLIDGYNFEKKDLDLVMDELVDKAIDLGYLRDGGRINLLLDSEDDKWVEEHGDSLSARLNERLRESMSVTIQVSGKNDSSHQV